MYIYICIHIFYKNSSYIENKGTLRFLRWYRKYNCHAGNFKMFFCVANLIDKNPTQFSLLKFAIVKIVFYEKDIRTGYAYET